MTCIVAGPTRSGKSTFVYNLLSRMNEFIDAEFEYITLFLGTEAKNNPTLSSLSKIYPNKMEIIELKSLYKDRAELTNNFSIDFENYVNEKQKNKVGCIIFDDLMTELADTDVLLNLFTKYSSHSNVSSIHITQNIFFKTGGKHGSDHTTLYRNTHCLVLFKNPMDNSVIQNIARRLGSGKYKELMQMMEYIVDKYRYVVIDGHFDTNKSIRFRSDIFALEPVPHQKVFEL